MPDTWRHIVVVMVGAAVAVAGAYLHTCEHELFMIAATIIGGEFGLARTGPTTAVRMVDHPVTINAEARP